MQICPTASNVWTDRYGDLATATTCEPPPGGEPQTPLSSSQNSLNVGEAGDGSPRGPLETPNRQLGQTSSMTTPDTVHTDRILAAIANLSNRVDAEKERLSATFDAEIAALSLKIDSEINTLNVKVDRVAEHLEQVANLMQEHISRRVPPHNVNHNGPAAPREPWAVSLELRDRVYFYAYQEVYQPEIKAYTARESPNGDLLVHSLFKTIRRKINEIEAPWPAQHLPQVIDGFSDVAGSRLYNTLVKDAGKHARERLHHLLLHNIRNPRDPNAEPEGTVPNIASLVHRLARHCPRVPDPRDADTLWRATPWAQRLRVAYLRREALRVSQAVRRGEATPNIWKRVDAQLNHLRESGPLYSMAFYKLVYSEDLATFDGDGRISAIPPDMTFDLPDDQAITDQMDLLEVEGAATLEDAMAL
ncbi:hypothetical protein DFH28DRAFT_1132267 [Melampsora americana]|nr:hypothetical protein DFH28DRAFT_1132267 [Melampsora americana]